MRKRKLANRARSSSSAAAGVYAVGTGRDARGEQAWGSSRNCVRRLQTLTAISPHILPPELRKTSKMHTRDKRQNVWEKRSPAPLATIFPRGHEQPARGFRAVFLSRRFFPAISASSSTVDKGRGIRRAVPATNQRSSGSFSLSDSNSESDSDSASDSPAICR